MLVLTRRVGESIKIGEDIIVTMVQIAPGKVRLGIQAPAEQVIMRTELLLASEQLQPESDSSDDPLRQ